MEEVLLAQSAGIKDLFPDKRVIVAFPPMRHSAQLKHLAHGHLQIGRANLAKSIFPDRIRKADGFTLRKPPEVFAHTENKDWILFFVEADALFGKRSERVA
jgi:hypothetical protein